MKKVSAETIRKYKFEERYSTVEIDIEGKPIEIKVKNWLNFDETRGFVNEVLSGLFVNGIYVPYNYTYAFNYCVLAYFTNINLPKTKDEEMGKDNHFIYNLCMCEKFMGEIKNVLKGNQIWELEDAVQKMVEYNQKIYLMEHQPINVLAKTIIEGQLQNIDEQLTKTKKTFESFDPSKLEALNEYTKVINPNANIETASGSVSVAEELIEQG